MRLITLTNSNHEIPNILEPGTWMDNFESDYFPIVYKILNVFKGHIFKLTVSFLSFESEIVKLTKTR